MNDLRMRTGDSGKKSVGKNLSEKPAISITERLLIDFPLVYTLTDSVSVIHVHNDSLL